MPRTRRWYQGFEGEGVTREIVWAMRRIMASASLVIWFDLFLRRLQCEEDWGDGYLYIQE